MNKKNYFSAIITHGDLAKSMEAVTKQLIVSSTKIYYYSNKKLSLDEIENAIAKECERLQPEKTVFFVDLIGGSCWILANRIKQNSQDIAVLGGVNLPMLVSYHLNYNRLEWNALLDKIVSDGKKGILKRL
jgi:mannose/fructose-specific phosphotransferase system component IIA